MSTAFTVDEVAAIRAATPGCTDDLIHLNHVGSSLPPQAVLDAQIGHLRREATIGGYEAAAEASERSDAVYASIASMVGARPSEVARMEHATGAWNAAFWSIPMRRGQRIITHDHDYGANWIAFLRAREIRGVEIERIPSDEHGQVDVARSAAALARPSEIALVSLAWIPTSGGVVNPAARVGELTRRAAVPFLLDACQAVGQIDVDVDEVGCDFLSATGRKYLRWSAAGLDSSSPASRSSIGLPRRNPIITVLTGWHATATRSPMELGVTSIGEYDHASWLGLGAAVDHARSLGVDRIGATIQERAEELRDGLRSIGVDVHDQGVERCGDRHGDPSHRAVRVGDVDVVEPWRERFHDLGHLGPRRHGDPGSAVDGASVGSLHHDTRRGPTDARRDGIAVTWVVLLRGINVGGHRKVPMGELRDALAEAGFGSPRTYIQSGNVIIDGGLDDERTVQRRVSEVIVERFGLNDVAVLAMSRSRLRHALSVAQREFPIGDVDPKVHRATTHVVFLDDVPSPTVGTSMAPGDFAPDRFVLDTHDGSAELHISYADGVGSSRLTVDRVERMLGVRATGRNLNTVDRLLALACP